MRLTQRQRWMGLYEKALSMRLDHAPGQVDWDLATYLYNSGKGAAQAAQDAKQPYRGQQGVMT